MRRSVVLVLFLTLISSSSIRGFADPKTSELVPSSFTNRIYKSFLPPTPEPRFIVIATVDGALHLVDILSKTVRWSFYSGKPTHSSFQASHYHDVDEHIASDQSDDFYVDCGNDGKLYKHYKHGGIEKLKTSEFYEELPKQWKGGVILGKHYDSAFLIDGKTGKPIWNYTMDESNSTLAVQRDEDKSIILAKDAGKLVESSPMNAEIVQNMVYIKRRDYVIQYRSAYGEVLWNVAYAEIEAEFQRPEIQKEIRPISSVAGNELKNRYIGDNQYPLPSEGRANVIRSHSMEDFSFLLGNLGSLRAREYKPSLGPANLGSLPALEYEPSLGPDVVYLLALPNDVGSHALYLPPSEIQTPGTLNMLGGNVTEMKFTSTFAKVFAKFQSFILYVASLLTLLSLYLFGSKLSRLRKQTIESNVSKGAPKKKKPKKSGNGKNSSDDERRRTLISNESGTGDTNGIRYSEGSETFTDLVSDSTNERRIAKLVVLLNRVIARGSNGTVVLEGVYDGRLVAVKRLVKTHHDVALKEIQNLIVSDQHPNIVRWYGVEYDRDFVYLSLERCACSLNDLIYISNGSSQNQSTTTDQDSSYLNEHFVQLNSTLEDVMDFQLRNPNGYLSPQILKIMRDVVSGLAHLHELGIIHRDLKPQNVLISKDRSLCAKLSDMGISKRLSRDMTSLTQNTTGYGSSGWQAPEQIRNRRQTRAVDLFSLGCVLFFCVTGGKHPYGDDLERDLNIVNDRKDLFLVQDLPEALDLFSSLLEYSPEKRPTAMDVLHHPFFWDSETKLSFLRDASDRVELEDRAYESELLEALETTGAVTLNGKWDAKMESAILSNIGRYRRYRYDSIRDLLRVIRNKLNHYRELPQEIRELLGSVPEGFYDYFSSRFPRLLIEVYNVLYEHCKEESFFQKYLQ